MTIQFSENEIPDFDKKEVGQAFEWLRRKAIHNSKNSDHAQWLCWEIVRLKKLEAENKKLREKLHNHSMTAMQ